MPVAPDSIASPTHDAPGGATTFPGWLRVLGWSAFLACSWTWCIGMFLPALLVRDFGSWSFLVFALPNCVGSAVLGWTIRSKEHAQALRSAHPHALRGFSIVTCAFQLSFILWVLASAPPAWRYPLLGLFLAITLLASPVRFLPVWIGLLSIALLAYSLGSAGVYVAGNGLPMLAGTTTPGHSPSSSAPTSLAELALLAPVCVFGFLLCPYLDPTFLQARADLTPRRAQAAFTLGFMVFFLAMILFTAAYTPALLNAMHGASAGWSPVGRSSASWPSPVWAAGAGVVVHVVVQASFTASIHHAWAGTVVARRAQPPRSGEKSAGVVGIVALVLVPVALAWGLPAYAGLSMPEVAYRCFMGFYGLVFPTYVWLCVLPSFGLPAPPTRRQLVVFTLAVVLAMPCFWLGFIERWTVALAPGILVPLLSRFFIGGVGARDADSREDPDKSSAKLDFQGTAGR